MVQKVALCLKLWLWIFNLPYRPRIWYNMCICTIYAFTSYAFRHYDDVIMGTMASLITSLTIVYSTVYSDADQRKHQSSASLAFVGGIHRGPVNSPHKWSVTRKMFPFDDVIMLLWKLHCFISTCVTDAIFVYRTEVFERVEPHGDKDRSALIWHCLTVKLNLLLKASIPRLGSLLRHRRFGSAASHDKNELTINIQSW